MDYRTNVNCRFICRCQNDEFVATIAHKPSCVKSGDLCKYTKNGTQVCSHILWVILNKLHLYEDDERLMQVTYATTELKDMLRQVKENRLAPTSTPLSSVITAHHDWKLQRMPLQRGPRTKCLGCTKRMFKAGDLCINVKGKYTPHRKDKNRECFDIDAVFRYCVKFGYVTRCAPRSILSFS